MLNEDNKKYWQSYKPGDIPSIIYGPPEYLYSGKILDVGTGDGFLAEQMAEKGAEVYGIDIAENIISANQQKGKANYMVGDITARVDFPDAFFDLTVFRFVLTSIHSEGWIRLNQEVKRVLKAGGKVWVMEPLVSATYQERYKLAYSVLGQENCLYVFSDKELAEKVKTVEELKKNLDKVIRIVKHYTKEELAVILMD
jgi:ubiquinone/menaquinone biosynthesis C-methylase UbiE